MCHKRFYHLLVIHFPHLIVTTSPGGDEIGLLQNMVAAVMCSVLFHNNVAAGGAGDGMVAAVGGSLQTPAGSALRIFAFLVLFAIIHPMPAPVCSGGDIVFAVAVDNCLVVFIVLFIILGTVVVNSVLGGDRSCVTKGFIIYLLYIFRI